jgi:hypothetical protein
MGLPSRRPCAVVAHLSGRSGLVITDSALGLRDRDSDGGELAILLPAGPWTLGVELPKAGEAYGRAGPFNGRLCAFVTREDDRFESIGLWTSVGGSGGSGFEQSARDALRSFWTDGRRMIVSFVPSGRVWRGRG